MGTLLRADLHAEDAAVERLKKAGTAAMPPARRTTADATRGMRRMPGVDRGVD